MLSDSPAGSGVSREVAVTGDGDSRAVLPLEESPVGDVWELPNLQRRSDKLVTVYFQT